LLTELNGVLRLMDLDGLLDLTSSSGFDWMGAGECMLVCKKER